MGSAWSENKKIRLSLRRKKSSGPAFSSIKKTCKRTKELDIALKYAGCYTNVETKTRQCLKCDKEFESLGSYNRICDRCNADNLTTSKGERIGSGNGRRVTGLHESSS